MNPQYGAALKAEHVQKYEQSSRWIKGAFRNFERTDLKINLRNIPNLIWKQGFRNGSFSPKQKLPILTPHIEAKPSYQPLQCVWYGHSAIFLQMAGLNILLDPMFGKDAAPISPLPVSRYSTDVLAHIDELPAIDLVLITHDHYDHLDLDSIKKLMPKTKQYLVALGVKRHLLSWGVEEDRIIEFDWWDEFKLDNISITFTPARHFSGRSLKDRNKSLWGGWALKTAEENIFFSGDSGYGQHFKMIGERLGPFDFGFIECGQYNKLWDEIHMFPEQSAQACVDAQIKCAMPIHWAGFSLSQHHWQDPIERFLKAANTQQLDYKTPQMGELFNLKSNCQERWWQSFN